MKRPGILICLLASLLFAAAAPRKPGEPASDGNRFLFVVETSLATKNLGYQLREALFDLVYTGLHDTMQPGDSFGVWTFNETPITGGCPMLVWETNHPLELALTVTEYLKTRPYEKKAKMAPLMAQIQAIIEDVKDVHVLIVGAKDTVVTGTPYDRELKSAWVMRTKDKNAAKSAYVTILAARGGRMVSAFLELAGQPLTVPHVRVREMVSAPEPPPRPPAATNAAAAALTNRATAVAAAQNPATNRPVRRIIEIRNEKKPPPEPEPAPLASTNEVRVAGAATATNAAETMVPATAAQPPAASTPAREGIQAAVASNTNPPVTTLNSAAGASAPASPAPETPKSSGMAMPVAAREPTASPAATNIGTAALAVTPPIQPQPGMSALTLTYLGAGIVLLAVALAWVSLRSLRRQARSSYISQSLDPPK